MVGFAMEEPADVEEPAAPPVYVLYVCGVCLLAGIVRLLSRWTVVHHTVVMFGLGALFGYLSLNYSGVHDYVNLDFLTSAKLLQVHTLLLPVVILEYLFSMDPRVFLSCSPVAVLTVILDYLLNLCFQGAFVFFILDFFDVPWDPLKTGLMYFLVGSLTCVTDTSYVVNTFYKMGSYWVLLKLMEIKRVISLVGACVVYIFVVYAHELHYQLHWHNCVIFIVINFVACPALGWLTAQIIIFWLGRLYNDSCVEITVSISVAYLLYYFGTVNITQKPMVSAIVVVVYALLLNNRRTCFSLGLDTFLHKLIRILAYVVKTVVFTIAGFLITYEDVSKFADHHGYSMFLPNVLISFTLYAWCALSRGLVCALSAPVLRRCGYNLSWQELSTMVFCNVTGTVCLITGVASCNIRLVDLFFGRRRIQYTLMFQLGVLAVIRSLVAGTFFRHVLKVLGMTHVSLGRYVAMSNALQKVQEQMKTSARSYKFDRFLADADWETVYEFTNFDNPYKDISRYSVIGRSMNLDSELLGDTRLNLLHAQKMSFWRQYEQGLLSLRALRILLEECYLAEWKVTTNSYDIGDQIRKHYETQGKKRFSVFKTLQQKFEQMHEVHRLIMDDITHAVNVKWKKMVLKVSLHVATEIILIIGVVIVSAGTIAILVYESTCSSDRYSPLLYIFYHHINIIFMVIFTVYITLRLCIFNWRYLLLFGSVVNISLLIIGWIDVCLDGIVVMDPSLACAEHIRTQWAIDVRFVFHKFFLICRCLRLFILLEDKTFFVLRTMKKRMLLQLQLGYDVGKAYVYCKEDIYKTAGEFIAQSATLEEIRREAQSSRVQLMHELAIVQKKYPGIVVSVKSQEACRRILHVAKETIDQLQRNGRVDAYEADMLDDMIKLRLKRLNKIPAHIEMPSVDTLISKLQWVNGDETLIKFLHFNSKLFNMAEGESADFDSDPTAGLYVLVSGLIRVNWYIGDPYGKLLQLIHTTSDMSIHSFGKMQLHDYMTTGSTFGELALLTQNPISVDAVCETTVLVYHIPYESIRTALDWVKEPSLEWRLWLTAAVRLSIPLLKALPGYYNLSLEDLKVLADQGSLIVRRLEGEIQHGSSEETFNLARYAASHVILVHGIAKKSDDEVFTGPIVIPPDNDDLVFSHIFCDVYVLYIVPHRTGGTGTSAGFAYSRSASDISTALEISREVPPQLPVSRAPVPKKRGRTSIVGTPGLAALKHLDRAVSSSADDETIGKKETKDESPKIEERLEEIMESEEDPGSKSHVLFSPPTTKPDSTTATRTSFSTQTVKSVEKIEPEMDESKSEEEQPEMPLSPPKPVIVNPEPTEEKPKETELKKPSVTRNEFTPVDVMPRRSISEIVRRTPWTEAWKHVSPQVRITVGKELEKPQAQRTSAKPAETSTAGVRDVAARTADPAAGKKTADTKGATTRQVTETSTTKPSTDVNKENDNVNNSNNNNSIIRLYYPHESEPGMSTYTTRNDGTTIVSVTDRSHTSGLSSTFRLDEESKEGKDAEDSSASQPMLHDATAESRKQVQYNSDDKMSNYTTNTEDGVSPELNQSVDSSASHLLATVNSFGDRDYDITNSEPSPFDLAADKAITPTTRDRDRWMIDSQRQPRAFTLGRNDSTTVHTSDELKTALSERERDDAALMTNEVTHAVPRHDTENAALLVSQSTSKQFEGARLANSKPAMSKIPDITTSKPNGRNVVKGSEGTAPRQPKTPDNARNTHATTSSQRHTYIDAPRPPSSTLRDDVDGGPVAESRSRSVLGGISSSAKPVTKPDSRKRKSSSSGVRTSRAPADSTRSSLGDIPSKKVDGK